MTKRKSLEGVLIVVELGAEWPTLPELREPAAGKRVLAQEDSESPSDFATRAAAELGTLHSLPQAAQLTLVVIACNERLDERATRARALVARSAIAALAKQDAGSLLLSVSDRNSGRCRHALSSLASELDAHGRRASVRAAVRFVEQHSVPTSPDISARVSALLAKESARKVA